MVETVKVEDLKRVLKKYAYRELNVYRVLRELGVKETEEISREDMSVKKFFEPLPLIFSAEDVVTIKGDVVYFKDYEYEEEPCEECYCIELDRIDNITKLVWWIHHLQEKVFFTRWMCSRLIEVITKRIGLKMYEGEG